MKSLVEAMKNLKEQAIRKSTLENKLVDSSDKICEHLIKCFIWKDSTGDLNHWCSEIASFLHDIPKIKNSKKLPSYKFIMKYTYEVYYDILDSTISRVVKDLIEWDNYKEVKYDTKTISKQIYKYFDWLSKELSTKGQITKLEVFNKIKEIIGEN